jgi:ATP-dependent exoDNAse (exonuclease V) beta subunit
MLVGDAKQSIYRFRGAEVSQFIELASGNAAVTESPSGGISERYQRSTRQLPVNYRSYQNIVSFNNHMVEQIANQFHSKELSDPAIEAVYRNGVQEPHHRETGFVSAERLKYEEDKTLGETCNDYVFEKVRDALERGYRCRDIAVLLRNNRESSEIALFLSQQDGIVVISEDSLNTGNSSEVKLILASMRLQRSPDEPVFQTQWIQWLFDTGRMSEPECDQAYRAIRERRFIDWTKENPEWSMEESWIALPPSEWVDLLLDYFQIEPDPYVSKFMDEAFQYQRKTHEIQQHFVDYALENLSKWNIETPKTIDAITVSTIHKSKGLEYPIVIVPLVGWDMSGKRDRVWVKTEGVAPFGELPFVKAKPSDIKSIQLFEEPYAIWKKKHVMDHSNLMYVAFTRAEKELYIGIVPKDYKASYSNSASAYFGDMIERFSSFQQLEDENSFFAGEKTRVEKSSHSGSEKNGSALSQNPVTHWRDRIRIAPKREKSWDEERSDRDMGIAIHRILAETDSRDNALKMALEMHQNGEISSSDYNRLEQRLQFIWDNENIAEIFDHDLQILNEKAILTPDGKNYRPDRIIVDKNNVRVIDFKTGQERKSHQKQILKYGQLLEEMGFSNVSPELFYLGENEIHIVKLNLP